MYYKLSNFMENFIKHISKNDLSILDVCYNHFPNFFLKLVQSRIKGLISYVISKLVFEESSLISCIQ